MREKIHEWSVAPSIFLLPPSPKVEPTGGEKVLLVKNVGREKKKGRGWQLGCGGSVQFPPLSLNGRRGKGG